MVGRCTRRAAEDTAGRRWGFLISSGSGKGHMYEGEEDGGGTMGLKWSE